MSNWTDFFFAFIKGPGWFPGTSRLGDISFVPEVCLLWMGCCKVTNQ